MSCSFDGIVPHEASRKPFTCAVLLVTARHTRSLICFQRSRHSLPLRPRTCVEMSAQFVGFPFSSIGTRRRKRASPPAGPDHESGWTDDASGGVPAHMPSAVSFENRGSAAEGGGGGSRTSRQASVSGGGEPCQYKSCRAIQSTAPVSQGCANWYGTRAVRLYAMRAFLPAS